MGEEEFRMKSSRVKAEQMRVEFPSRLAAPALIKG
jgi:hypothetical protein